MINERVKKQIAASVAVIIFLLAAAFFTARAEMPSWAHHISGASIALFALPAFWVTRRWLGWRDAIAVWAVMGIAAVGIETFAIATGVPYGRFQYSEMLGYKLFGYTPWTVALAWTPAVLAAYAVAAGLVGQQLPVVSQRLSASRIAIMAATLTAFDLVLDPAAVGLGFWRYDGGGNFYGVPLSNFLGWLITGAIAGTLLDVFMRKKSPLLPVPVQLVSSALFIVVFWSFVASFLALKWPAVIGFGIAAMLAGFYLKFRYEFDDMIVLCDPDATPIGTIAKLAGHSADTPLHLAFSVFIFDSRGRLLLQRRAESKKTWPGVWSNSCCGHVMLHETAEAAAKRRLQFELGLEIDELNLVLPDFRYRAEKDGVVENEICPVFVGFADAVPVPNPDEVSDIRWTDWNRFVDEVGDTSSGYSPWAREEAELLSADAEFGKLYSKIAGEWRNSG
jgi:isopentenyl-diphosphate delta-isomerase